MILLQFSGCGQEKTTSLEDDKKLKQLLPSTMVSAIENKELSAEIPIYILNKSNGKRVPNTSLRLKFKNDQTSNYPSDTNGVVKLPISPLLLKENPQVSISHKKFKPKDLEVKVGGKTMVFKDGESSNLIDYNSLSSKKMSSGLKVYFKDDEIGENELKKERADFVEIYRIVDSLVGLKNSAIYPALVKSQIAVTVGVPDSMNIVPVKVGNPESKYWFFTHELVERNLMVQEFYKQNSDIRWIGDGIAEFISHKVVETLEKQKPEIASTRLKELQDLDNENFSLWEWKVPTEQEESFTPGYGLSLAYWLKIDDEYGINAIKNFVKDFKKLNDISTASVKSCLENNFPGINTDVKITVKEAMKILKKVSK